MRRKSPFHSLIVGVSCAMVGCILASTAYSRRVDELEIERDIYASRFQNWQMRAIDAEENVGRLQTEVDNLTAELNAQIDLTLTYAGSFSCTAYCAEEYAHICGEGHGITSSGAKVQPGVTVAADTSILPYGTVVYMGQFQPTAEHAQGYPDHHHCAVLAVHLPLFGVSGVR